MCLQDIWFRLILINYGPPWNPFACDFKRPPVHPPPPAFLAILEENHLKRREGKEGCGRNHAWLRRAAWMTAAARLWHQFWGSQQTVKTAPTSLAKLQCSCKTFCKLIRGGKGQPVAREQGIKGLIGSVLDLIWAVTILCNRAAASAIDVQKTGDGTPVSVGVPSHKKLS